MQHSRVCIFLCTRCLISPSGERSHGMSSALITFGRVAYSARNCSEATRSSARKVLVAEPDSAACLSWNGISPCLRSDVGRRFEILMAGRQLVGRPFDHFLKQQVHEQKQRLRLEHQKNAVLVFVVVEMLVDAAVLDQHYVAGLPLHGTAVVDIVAVALEDVKYRAVEMTVLLTGIERRIAFDMRLDRLHDVDRLRRDHVLAVHRRSALPRMILRGIDARLFQQLFVKMAVGSFERADEGALLGPALPFAVLDLVGVFFRRLIVPEPGRFVFQHSGHALRSFEIFLRRHLRRHYGISAARAMRCVQCSICNLAPRAARGIYRASLKVYDRMQPDRERVRMTKNAGGSALAAVLVLVVAFPLVTAARAQSVADFYRGKTIDLNIGYSVGGGYDLYARLIARRLGAHIPGNPTVVPKNMEGAGSLRLANYLYSAAPNDGTVIGAVSRGAAFDPLLNEKGSRFEASKFSWIGSANNEVSVCVARASSAVTKFDDLFTSQLTIGSTGAADDTYQ